MIDRVHAFPGASERLHRIVEGPDFAAVTRVALDAVDTLRQVWEPLSAEAVIVALTSTDPTTAELVDVSRPHRLLACALVPKGVLVGAVTTDPVVREAPSLARVTIDAWLADALGETSAPAHGEWSELAFHAGRAWAGPPTWRADEAELHLRHEAGTVVAPIERDAAGAWLSGPRAPAFDQPPLDVRFTYDTGSLTLTITRHYGNWIDASPASERLNQRLAVLRTSGWG